MNTEESIAKGELWIDILIKPNYPVHFPSYMTDDESTHLSDFKLMGVSLVETPVNNDCWAQGYEPVSYLDNAEEDINKPAYFYFENWVVEYEDGTQYDMLSQANYDTDPIQEEIDFNDLPPVTEPKKFIKINLLKKRKKKTKITYKELEDIIESQR